MWRFGAAFAGIVAVTPAVAGGAYPAAPPASGSPLYSSSSIVGDAGLGAAWLSGPNAGAAAGNVRVNVPWASGWNEEVETAGVLEFKGVSAGGVFTHTYYKTSGWAAGAEVGVADLNGQGLVPVGVEGVVFLPSAMISGQAIYNPSISKFGFPSFWTASIEGSYYFEPNTKLSGAIFWSNIKFLSSEIWIGQVSLEHRWAGTPFSTFLTALVPNHNVWAFGGGVRVFFDQPNATLHSHDYDVPFHSALSQPLL